MRTALATAPAEEPVDVATARRHLRIEVADEDDLISGLIVAARQVVELHLRRALVTQTWDAFLGGWTYGGGYYYRSARFAGPGHGWLPRAGGVPIEFPNPPLQAVEWVRYRDGAGMVQTLDPGAYEVVPGTPGQVRLTGPNLPGLGTAAEPVTIRYVAGYGPAAAVPQTIKQAMLLLVGHWYDNREAAAEPRVGAGVTPLPMGVDALLSTEVWGSYS